VTLPPAVHEWLVAHGYGRVIARQPVGGGCINNGARLESASGRTFFLKTNAHTPADMFAREAEGLEVLRLASEQAGGPRFPEALLYGPDFLLLEDLAPAARQEGYWPAFGRQLAALHNVTHSQFGFAHDNYIGSTPQPNPWMADGHAFFGEQRLLFQARLAQRRGLLSAADVRRVEKLAQRLPELVPAQPASLLHGDLWSGNVMTDSQGRPALIDPAAHYGWAEAELAMTVLFGSFPEPFYRAYEDVRVLELGFRQRFPIYNLYHLLNHLNLFGTGYLGQVLGILQQFG
jgi:protein-ribulosamine 3-kinase